MGFALAQPEVRNIRIGHPMRRWQWECARESEAFRFFVLVLHRRAGKTELILKKLIDASIKCQLPSPLFFYVAPYLKQAKVIAWIRLKEMVKPLVETGYCEINESELYVYFYHNQARLRIYGADNPDAMRGVTLDGCGIDEVKDVKPEVWEEILRPALSDRKGWAWFQGTPKGINLFSSLYFSAAARPGWGTKLYTCYDTDALPPEEIEQLKHEMSEQAFAREMLCDFSAAGEDQLISLMDVDEAVHRVYHESDIAYAPRIMGVDPARFGNDRSVIAKRQGLQWFPAQSYKGLDNMELAGRVATVADQWEPDAIFIDAGGPGAGVIDRLRQLGYGQVVEVNFGGKPMKSKYVNKRTEMWFDMAEALGSGAALPNDVDLKVELATPTYSYNAKNQLVLESKDAIKKRMPGGASPDIADAFALTYAFPVMPEDKLSAFRRQQRQSAKSDYDPYNREGSYNPYGAVMERHVFKP